MVADTEALYNDLITEIKVLASEKDVLKRSEKAVWAIISTLDQLKELIRNQGFRQEEEEISFYKYLMPKFHALYIYYASVFSIETDKPPGSKKVVLKYFRDELRKIDNFFYHNLELYKYYRSGSSHLDKEYFTRGRKFGGFMIDIIMPIINPEFCTLGSIKVAFLIAYQQLREYFQSAMMEMESPAKTPVFGPSPVEITWTDSKTGLIELAYALHAAGSFNNGKTDLKQVIEYMETVFHVELGNTSRTFQEILARKKGHTSFLDRLKDKLLSRIQSHL